MSVSGTLFDAAKLGAAQIAEHSQEGAETTFKAMLFTMEPSGFGLIALGKLADNRTLLEAAVEELLGDQPDVYELLLVKEAWRLTVPGEMAELPLDDLPRPHEHPDRERVLMVTWVRRGETAVSATCSVDVVGDRIVLGEWVEGEPFGPLVELLERAIEPKEVQE